MQASTPSVEESRPPFPVVVHASAVDPAYQASVRAHLADCARLGWQPAVLVVGRGVQDPAECTWLAFLEAPLYVDVAADEPTRQGVGARLAGWYRPASTPGHLELLDPSGAPRAVLADPRAAAPAEATAEADAGAAGVAAPDTEARPERIRVDDVGARMAFLSATVFLLRGLRFLAVRTLRFLREHERISIAVVVVPALALCAAAVIPSPWVAHSRMPSIPISGLIDVPRPGVTQGELRVALVRSERPSWLRYLMLRRDEDVSFQRAGGPASAGDDPAPAPPTGDAEQLPSSAHSAAVAALVEAKLARRGTIGGTGVHVVNSMPGLGVSAGDTITSVDGRRVSSMLEWQRVLQRHEPGDLVSVQVAQRPRAKAFVWLVPTLATARHFAPSVVVEDRGLRYDLGFTPRFDPRMDVEGPSAGLALGIDMYAALVGEDLLRGRTVTVTGSIESSGTVGPIGGLRQKVLEAMHERPDILLVPASQAAEAERFGRRADFPIVGVDSLGEAIRVLRLPTPQESAEAVAPRVAAAGLGTELLDAVPDTVRTDESECQRSC